MAATQVQNTTKSSLYWGALIKVQLSQFNISTDGEFSASALRLPETQIIEIYDDANPSDLFDCSTASWNVAENKENELGGTYGTEIWLGEPSNFTVDLATHVDIECSTDACKKCPLLVDWQWKNSPNSTKDRYNQYGYLTESITPVVTQFV